MSVSLRVYIFILFIVLIQIPSQYVSAQKNLTTGLIKEDYSSLRYSFPIAENWSFEKLSRALLYAREIGSTAVVVMHDGQLVLEWGKTNLRIKSHSVRKSLLSALYGIAVEKGFLDVTSTMANLGVDDRPPRLSENEKQATILDLLQSRSGIYHEAAAETEYMKRSRPSRGAFRPGEHWYYNNWDFNALGTIFEIKTNIPIGQAFKEWIADPIEMQDFRAEDVHYRWKTVSLYPSYPFWVSARDLARFGQLYLQMGKWKDQQVIPESWVYASIFPYSKSHDDLGYGFMWWIHSSGAYFAHGHMGQFIVVIPSIKIVVVNRVFSGTPSMGCLSSEIKEELKPFTKPVSRLEFKRLVVLILEAMPAS
ncbi:MAG: serine hydrolase [Desulfobulbaceae bacterium]|nr:serine hydrolase [Desulfobulbaceae bacterium]